MKVTVTFGDTAVVVPCKAGWTVRELTEQATRRYRRVIEKQHGEVPVNIHHLEYEDGGILDIDDLLGDLVEDREKLVAIFEEDRRGGSESPRDSISNGFSSDGASPEAMHYYPHLEYDDPNRGEIEVNEAILKANTPLLVRSSSDSALAPPQEKTPSPPPDEESYKPPPEPEISNVLKGALERLHTDSPPPRMTNQVNFSTLTKTVEFPGDRAPLGIHVVPYCSSLSGRPLGLHIKGIEENSRSKRDNLFKEDECIVQINDTPLQDKTFAQSQEVFRQAMSSPSVRVEVLPVGSKPRYEKSLIGQLFTGDGKDSPVNARSPVVNRAPAKALPELKPAPKVELKQPETRSRTPEPVLQNAPPLQHQPGPLERDSPTPPAQTGNSSPTPRTGSQSPLANKSPTVPPLSNLTNKKGGKRIKIDLRKGTEGLGFTVVTRDSSVHGPGPILVKNILQRGAAVKDGRLQPGDRILEVNGVDMTGRTQEELVAMLRSTKQGETVSVLVSRQEDIFLPRELKGEEASSKVMEDGREQLMYEIPLNETGSAGLGVSLKGNRSKETGEDLGIFIKSIIHGGAAYKDGRLRINDQLIAVNGESLLGRSNHAAMETLRRSMSSEGNMRGTIQLVVLRASKQAGGGNSAPRATTSSNYQPNVKLGSSNQVQVGDVCQLQPVVPHRASSLLPTLRRRASEPLSHSHRQRCRQRPGETHTRYTYGFKHKHTCQGFSDDGSNARHAVQRSHKMNEFGFVSNCQSPDDSKRPKDGNLNRERHETEHTRYHMFADTYQGRARLENTHGRPADDYEGNMQHYAHKSRHRRSRTLDDIQSSSYIENIRAMAGQMYGDPPSRSRIPTTRNAYFHNYAHNRVTTRRHMQLSDGP